MKNKQGEIQVSTNSYKCYCHRIVRTILIIHDSFKVAMDTELGNTKPLLLGRKKG